MIYGHVYANYRLLLKNKWRMSVDKGDYLFTLCFSMSSIQTFGWRYTGKMILVVTAG